MGQRLLPGWVRGCLPVLACAAGLMPLGCGSELSSPDGGGQPGVCSANVPAGQPCNTLANVATSVTPTCVTEAMPAGTGGTIVDGTYVLTAQTYYNVPACPMSPISETVVIAGSCFQVVFGFGDVLAGNGSTSVTVQGNSYTQTSTCTHFEFDASAQMSDGAGKTYSATATTFTLFTNNSAVGNDNPDRVEVLTRR
jgi:hypothetical protein